MSQFEGIEGGGGGWVTLLDLLEGRQIKLSNYENGNVASKRERLLVIGMGGFRGGGGGT